MRTFQLAAVSLMALAAPAHANPVQSVRQLPTGLELQTEDGVLTVEPWSNSIVHVRFGPAGYRGNYNPAVIAAPEKVAFKLRQSPEAWFVITPKLTARINKA